MSKVSCQTLILLLLACIGASWFSYQCLLVPHSAEFAPDWENAQWIRAADAQTPVAYFRYVTSINVLPDAAFVMVAATQVFRLYVNGTFVASNAADFSQNSTPTTYIYDINALLHSGADVVALRVANADQQSPCVRVSFGLVRGKTISYSGSGIKWQATAQSTLVYPRSTTKTDMWTTTDFQSYVWPPAQVANNMSLSPALLINPLLYEHPVTSYWMSAGAGHDAYFVRQIAFDASSAWLRLVANGEASVFINGHLLIIWNGQAPILRQKVASYLSNAETPIHYRTGLALGAYDITPYLHGGINTLAVHIANPGASATQVGLDSVQAATALDILISDTQGHNTWLLPDATWHVSTHPVTGWESGTATALRWPSPVQVARPGVSSTFYVSGTSTLRNIQIFPSLLLAEIVLWSCGGVVGLWLLIALGVLRRYYASTTEALATLSAAYIPALISEALLMVLSREPLLPQTFPYTYFWGCILIAIVGTSYILFWLNVRSALQQNFSNTPLPEAQKYSFFKLLTRILSNTRLFSRWRSYRIYPYLPARIVTLFYRHWMLLPLIIVSLPLVCYNLAYEPLWQDELSSYYAAHGILAHGLPFFPSGFLYEKAELYSYVLALWIALFGDSQARFISVIEYIASIPLLYFVGCYFFRRRVALLATAMLTLSPSVLLWARQTRMYEQAQLLTLLVMYLFCRAVQEPRRLRFLYIALSVLILDYLSHEEVFIILPALIISILFLSKDGRRRFPSVLYQKQWWLALFIGSTCIAIQLLLTRVTHPPILGTDSSQRPFIQFSTDNVPFYLNLLFFPSLNRAMPWITLNSVLAVIGCIWTRYDDNPRAKYCAVFLCASFFTLIFSFTMHADRYFYPLLPAYYLIGSYALVKLLDAAQVFMYADVVQKTAWNVRIIQRVYLSRQMRWLLRYNLLLACMAVLLAPMFPISNYNLFVSRIAGLSYHRHYPDYDAVGHYMQQHWQKGDVVISVAPDFSTFYYTGHVDYFFSIDRALFLFERAGHIVDTSIGVQALFNQDDFSAVLAAHTRIWIVSDNAEYQAEVAKRFVFPADFHIVFEGYGSAVYFRGDDG